MTTAKSAIAQVVQIGVESERGVAVPADIRLQSMNIQPSINPEIDATRPAGSFWPTLTTLNREWSTATAEGKPTFDEILFPLASVLTRPVTTIPVGGTLSRLHTFEPDSYSANDPLTYTVEYGDAESARLFAGAMFPGISLNATREAFDISAPLFGGKIEGDKTLTADPDTIALVPITPGQLDVYLDDTAAALGTTKLDLPFTLNTSIADRHNPVWAMNTDHEAYATTVEGEPSSDINLVVAVDESGFEDILDTMRTGATKFLRFEAIGPIIEGTIAHRFTLDLAVKVMGANDFSDQEGVYAIGWTLGIVHDATWDAALKCEVVNTTDDITPES